MQSQGSQGDQVFCNSHGPTLIILYLSSLHDVDAFLLAGGCGHWYWPCVGPAFLSSLAVLTLPVAVFSHLMWWPPFCCGLERVGSSEVLFVISSLRGENSGHMALPWLPQLCPFNSASKLGSAWASNLNVPFLEVLETVNWKNQGAHATCCLCLRGHPPSLT